MPRAAMTETEKRCASVVRHIDAYKAERYRKGDDKDTVAKKLGLSYGRLKSILRTSPESVTLSELSAIANAMNISISTLIGG
jgi:transcriptional regulator with XRE-family HTH domain